MNAEIDLVAASADELTALRASLASREAFTRYGIDKPAFLSTITFKVGKGKDGRDSLLVHSTDAIPEPFVTFLVEVNWARGRLMREYTVLLDPPVYSPGEAANSAAPVAAAITGAPSTSSPPAAASASAVPPAVRRSAPAIVPTDLKSSSTTASPIAASGSATDTDTIRVGSGETLTRIARALRPEASSAVVDQTMMALYRSNPEAFGRNINILRQGAILRVPNADQIAALNQREAMIEVHRQIESWRASEGTAPPPGHLRLVTPGAAGGVAGTSGPGTVGASGSSPETAALKARVQELEAQLAESKRLVDIRSGELSALQRKLAAAAAAAAAPPPTPPAPAKVPVAAEPVTAPTPTPVPATPTPPVTSSAVPPPKPVPAPVDSESWIDWLAANWWIAIALLAAVLVGLGLAAMKRRREEGEDVNRLMDATDVADPSDTTSQLGSLRKPNESFLVEESGLHPVPDFGAESSHFSDTNQIKSPDETTLSENSVSLDQGDPLAEADFHMAYGLYDQAADLVRIALEREPERRDLRLKLLEIYFVWGNKDAFLQTAKSLEATRERAPAGEWDKILIMGKQICPEEPLFGAASGGGLGSGAPVDLNLEGGENRVDIDLFGDPEGERSSLDGHFAPDGGPTGMTGEAAGLHTGSDLDFTLDAPERGADESPTRQMPSRDRPPRDEPTVESELMEFGDANFVDAPAQAPTTQSPAPQGHERHELIAAKLPSTADQTAEVSIDDLGLDLDSLETTGAPIDLSHLEETDHPSDAPTMVAGLDERSRRIMADAERAARDRELSELERELESSFVTDLDAGHDQNHSSTMAQELSPTVLMRREPDQSPTSRFTTLDAAQGEEREKDLESTSRLRGIDSESIDLDLDRLAAALGSGETAEQSRAAEDLFSSDVFEGTQHDKLVDLDVGESLLVADSPTNRLQAQTNKLKALDIAAPEMEPVTMSEVGTKLDLARAYMDMGDPEGARSILEEVVQEGSTSQKQEAARLIESLPG